MIIHQNQIFQLSTDTYSYLFRVNSYGILEHLHFGAPVRTEDAEGFLCHSSLGWGSCVQLSDRELQPICLDDRALEWSGSGRGDYRESPVELAGQSTDFRFVAAKIHERIVIMESGLPQPHGDCQTLEVTLEQPGAKLTLYYTAFETVLTRRTVLENTGDSPITVQKLMSTAKSSIRLP